jgi:hypothetical protein
MEKDVFLQNGDKLFKESGKTLNLYKNFDLLKLLLT